MVLAKKDHLLKTEPDEGKISFIHLGMELSHFNSYVFFYNSCIVKWKILSKAKISSYKK